MPEVFSNVTQSISRRGNYSDCSFQFRILPQIESDLTFVPNHLSPHRQPAELPVPHMTERQRFLRLDLVLLWFLYYREIY